MATAGAQLLASGRLISSVTPADTPAVRPLLALAAVAATLLAPAPAQANHEKNLWATINICDSPRHPDSLGVRGRMPGNGERQRMYMRFFAQFRDEGRWKSLKPRGNSPRAYVGSALFRFKEGGYTFDIEVPSGQSVTFRGIVKYEWRDRAGKQILRRTRRETTARHPTTTADPKNFSAARCTIDGPPTVTPQRRAAERDARGAPVATFGAAQAGLP